MSGIFISYRRDDSADVTGRIYDRLIQHLDRESVFKDVDSMPFGVDFRTYLDAEVAKCHVFLAVIGRDWLKSRGSKGKLRLEQPGDFVRIEIESALKRDIPVIPVLVRGASIPAANQVPASMQGLVYRNAITIRADPDFHRDMDRLIEYLKQMAYSINMQEPNASHEPANKGQQGVKASADQPKKMLAQEQQSKDEAAQKPNAINAQVWGPDTSIEDVIKFLQGNDDLIKQLMETPEGATTKVLELAKQLEIARYQAKMLIDLLGALHFQIAKLDDTRIRQRALLAAIDVLRRKYQTYRNDHLRRGIYAAEISSLHLQLANTFRDETTSQKVVFEPDELATYREILRKSSLDEASRRKRAAVVKAAAQLSRLAIDIARKLLK